MTEAEKKQILILAKEFFKKRLVNNHIANTKKLTDISEFNINPFLIKYLAQFAFGDSTPESMAKALIYPRTLGTSITTSFGTNIQYFCSDVLTAFASTTSGIDIEFIDVFDNYRKYCQVKAGPNTINKDDVPVIKEHFRGLINLARVNGLRVSTADCVVGVLYGTDDELSGHYKKLKEDYTVLVGRDFWEHITGDKDFYDDLIAVFSEVANEVNGTELINNTIDSLAKKLKK